MPSQAPLSLMRSYRPTGDRVSIVLQRTCACGNHVNGEQECQECRDNRSLLQRKPLSATGAPSDLPTRHGSMGWDFGKMRSQSGLPNILQPRLTISHPGDLYEQEADNLAEQVTADTKDTASILLPGAVAWRQHPAPVRVTPLAQRMIGNSEREGEDLIIAEEAPEMEELTEQEDFLQAAHAGDSRPPDVSLERRLEASEGQGRALPHSVRQYYESRLGVDLSAVRLHTDARASRMNEEIDALAFTQGRDIYFRSGQYAPHTPWGGKLLAHELVHVIQQSGGALSPTRSLAGEVQRHLQAAGYRGATVHDKVEDALRQNNSALITEAPIPGGTRENKYKFDSVGSADLYVSSDEGMVSGVKGYYKKTDLALEESDREHLYKGLRSTKAKVKSGAVKYKPKYKGKNKPFDGDFPDWFKVADLKPLALEKIGEGIGQVGNYVSGFEAFVRQANKDGKVSKAVTKGGLIDQLSIPAAMDYTKFQSESATLGPGSFTYGGVKERSRYWLHYNPALGLCLYFKLPHPYPAEELRVKIEAVMAALQPLKQRLNPPRRKIGTELDITPKTRRSSPRPARPRLSLQARLRRVQRNGAPATDWRELGRRWEEDRAIWDRDQAKPFLKTREAKVLNQKVSIDKTLGIASSAQRGASAKQASDFQSIEVWSGTTGKLLGKVRFLFGGTVDKVVNFVERMKARFKELHGKVTGIPASHGGGWLKRLTSILIKGIKTAFVELVKGLFRTFATCIGGLVEKTLDMFTKEISEQVTSLLEGVQNKFETFHDYIATEFFTRFAGYEQLIKDIAEAKRWLDKASTWKKRIQRGVQIVSCLAPPGLGCLWGLLARFAMDEALDLLVDTDWFKEEFINPVAEEFMDGFIGDTYRELVADSLKLVGLDQYAAGIHACGIEAVSPAIVKSYLRDPKPGLRGEDLLRHRANWEDKYADRIKESLQGVLKNDNGQQPSDQELVAWLEALQDSGLSPDKIKELFDASRQGDKVNIDEFRRRLNESRMPRPQGGGESPGEGGGGRSKPDVIIEKGLRSSTRQRSQKTIEFGTVTTPGGRSDAGETTTPGVTIRF